MESLLGPATFHRVLQDHHERVYVTPHALVQLITDSNNDVLRLAVTVKDRKLRLDTAIMTHKMLRLTLPLDDFSKTNHEPDRVHIRLGARRFGYSEFFYFGNAGAYQFYAISYNDVSTVGNLDFAALRAADLQADDDGYPLPNVSAAQNDSFLRLRRGSRPNTIIVASATTGQETLMKQPVGVDLDHMRALPSVMPD